MLPCLAWSIYASSFPLLIKEPHSLFFSLSIFQPLFRGSVLVFAASSFYGISLPPRSFLCCLSLCRHYKSGPLEPSPNPLPDGCPRGHSGRHAAGRLPHGHLAHPTPEVCQKHKGPTACPSLINTHWEEVDNSHYLSEIQIPFTGFTCNDADWLYALNCPL